jgi:hypothetical protein
MNQLQRKKFFLCANSWNDFSRVSVEKLFHFFVHFHLKSISSYYSLGVLLKINCWQWDLSRKNIFLPIQWARDFYFILVLLWWITQQLFFTFSLFYFFSLVLLSLAHCVWPKRERRKSNSNNNKMSKICILITSFQSSTRCIYTRTLRKLSLMSKYWNFVYNSPRSVCVYTYSQERR